MATYYETLKIAPTATATEIARACDDLYDQWRRLTTHHDPKMVTQASQALQEIEAIRSTLVDREKRSVYDAAIGVGAIGGLADLSIPGASLVAAGAPPPPPSVRATAGPPVAASAAGAGLWACPQCRSDNPPNTKFCLTDGTQLVRDCPECSQMASLLATNFCGECGYRYDVATRRRALKDEMGQTEQRLTSDRQALETRERAEEVADQRLSTASEAKARQHSKFTWAGIVGVLSLILLFAVPPFGVIGIIIAIVLLVKGVNATSGISVSEAETVLNSANRAALQQREALAASELHLERLQGEYDGLAVRR